MVRCKDCKHLSSVEIKGLDGFVGMCNLTISRNVTPKHAGSKAVSLQRTLDAYAFNWLQVKPDFGCVQGEPKEGASDGQV